MLLPVRTGSGASLRLATKSGSCSGGGGGLGQLLAFHMGLFHMGKTATLLGAMLLLVAAVDMLSYATRRWMTR